MTNLVNVFGVMHTCPKCNAAISNLPEQCEWYQIIPDLEMVQIVSAERPESKGHVTFT